MKRACYDRSENCVKNKFYSTVRKGIRKLNIYIAFKRKNTTDLKTVYKNIQPVFLSKLVAVVDGNFEEKLEVKQPAIELGIGTDPPIQKYCNSLSTFLELHTLIYQVGLVAMPRKKNYLIVYNNFPRTVGGERGKKRTAKSVKNYRGTMNTFTQTHPTEEKHKTAMNANNCSMANINILLLSSHK